MVFRGMGSVLAGATVLRVRADGWAGEVVDDVATEVEVGIYVGGVPKVFLSTSPHMFLELGLGYALANRLLVDESCVRVEGTVVELCRAVEVARSCSFTEGPVVDVDVVFRFFDEVMGRATLFRRTGCFHVAAIAVADGGVIDVVEDVSRHCALYKVIGSAYRRGVDFRRSIIIMSSRAAEGLMKSIANVCIPIAVFRGAPTLNAIDIARKNSITLIAHVRGDRFNVYSGADRVRLKRLP